MTPEEIAADRKRRALEGADPNGGGFSRPTPVPPPPGRGPEPTGQRPRVQTPQPLATAGGSTGYTRPAPANILDFSTGSANPQPAQPYQPAVQRGKFQGSPDPSALQPTPAANPESVANPDVIARRLGGRGFSPGTQAPQNAGQQPAQAPVAPALVPGLRTLTGGRGSVASSIGSNGENVYDNASAARVEAGLGAMATAAGLKGQPVPGVTTFAPAPERLTAAAASTSPQASAAGAGPANNFGGYSQPNGGPALPGTLTSVDKRAGAAGTYAGNLSAPVVNDYSGGGFARDRAAYDAPGTRLTGNTIGADRERLARISEIDNQISSLGSLNTNGKRDLAGQLTALKAGLTRDAFNQAGDFTKTGAQLNAGGAEAALNANASADEGAANRGADFAKTALVARAEAQRINQSITGEDGSTNLLRNDGTLSQLTGADGKPFKAAATKADGEITPRDRLASLTTRLGGLDQFSDPEGTQRAALQQEIQALDTGGNGSGSNAGPPAEAVAELKKNPKSRAQFDAAFGPGAAAKALGE